MGERAKNKEVGEAEDDEEAEDTEEADEGEDDEEAEGAEGDEEAEEALCLLRLNGPLASAAAQETLPPGRLGLAMVAGLEIAQIPAPPV